MSPSKFPQIPFTLDALVSEIHSILGPDGGIDSEHIDHREIMALMEEYNSKATDWSKYAIFDESRAYTRNLVDDGNGKFNLMILAWTKGQKSPIHDHSGSHCIMKILDGELQETQYEWPSMSGDAAAPSSDITEAVDHADALSDDQNKNNPLAVTQQTVLRPNEVAYINDTIGLHRIANHSASKGAVSLHLYTPPYQVCKTFEEQTGRARSSGKCGFYSVKGKKC